MPFAAGTAAQRAIAASSRCDIGLARRMPVTRRNGASRAASAFVPRETRPVGPAARRLDPGRAPTVERKEHRAAIVSGVPSAADDGPENAGGKTRSACSLARSYAVDVRCTSRKTK